MKSCFVTAGWKFALPVILLVCARAAPAQDKKVSATHLQSETPDWSGYYRLARGKDLGDFKPVNTDLDKAIIPHLQSWAKAKMEATDGVADDTGGVCLADGIFRYPPFAGSFIWLTSPNKIVLAFTEINTAGIRRIYLNRKHPKDVLPTWNGDSIGHWEGDTLVVDTTGFNDKSWLMSAMEPHTEETHLTERIRQVDNGQMIEIKSVVEDRHALTSAYTYTRYYNKNDAAMPAENVCNDEIAEWKEWRNKALKKQYDRAHEVK